MATDPHERAPRRPARSAPNAVATPEAQRSTPPPTGERTPKPKKERSQKRPKSEGAPAALNDFAREAETLLAAPAPQAATPTPAEPAAAPKAAEPAPAARPTEKPAPAAPKPGPTPLPDFEALSRNVARFLDESGKLASLYLKPREDETKSSLADSVADAFATFGKIAERYLTDPQRAVQAQSVLSKQFVDLWATTLQRLQGEKVEPVAPPDPSDKRFSDPEWRDNPYYDFLKTAQVRDDDARSGDLTVPRASTITRATRRNSICVSSPPPCRQPISCRPIRSWCARPSLRAAKTSSAACKC